MDRPYKYFDIIMALFVSVLLISNIASAAKIVNLGLPVLTFNAGTLPKKQGFENAKETIFSLSVHDGGVRCRAGTVQYGGN